VIHARAKQENVAKRLRRIDGEHRAEFAASSVPSQLSKNLHALHAYPWSCKYRFRCDDGKFSKARTISSPPALDFK